ncbi:unnamed protein product [Penicillium glandicola]
MAARTTLLLRHAKKVSTENQRRIWAPLNLDNLDDKKQTADRLKILKLIREVYNPMFTTYLSIPGNDWRKQFTGSKTKAMETKLGGLYASWTVPTATPSNSGMTMNRPHPKAPKAVHWASINALWPVINPPIYDDTLDDIEANETQDQIEDTEEEYEEIDQNYPQTPTPTSISPTGPLLRSAEFLHLAPSKPSRGTVLAADVVSRLASFSAPPQALYRESRQVASRAFLVDSLLGSDLVLAPVTSLVSSSTASSAASSATASTPSSTTPSTTPSASFRTLGQVLQPFI